MQLLKFDITLQWRQGFWLVYFVVSAIYCVILLNAPAENRFFVTSLLILSDTSLLGIIFVGALILLEKQQNVLQSLFVTPLSLHQYLISKTASLTLIAICMSMLIYVIPNGLSANILTIVGVIISSSVIFTLLGIGVAASVKTLNQYITGVLLCSVIIIAPTILFLTMENMDILIFFPINAAIELMLSCTEAVPAGQILLSVSILFFWCALAYRFAFMRYQKHVLKSF